MFILIIVLLIFFLIFLLLEDKSQASETTHIYLKGINIFRGSPLCFGDFEEQDRQKSSSIALSTTHSSKSDNRIR